MLSRGYHDGTPNLLTYKNNMMPKQCKIVSGVFKVNPKDNDTDEFSAYAFECDFEPRIWVKTILYSLKIV